ncbi:MAG: GlsB/YeaQ/YmgE family stress response membrane protein [Hyphomicrobiaceae bacterium]|nr:GlsB/YeaQ/YmgE family stress response membrane protein [Hyphomicrobiaceae bacterium]
MDITALVIWLVMGIAAGWLASLVMGGGGLIRYLISGVIGSVVGSYLFGLLGISLPIDNVWINHILVSAAGAVIVIAVARMLA